MYAPAKTGKNGCVRATTPQRVCGAARRVPASVPCAVGVGTGAAYGLNAAGGRRPRRTGAVPNASRGVVGLRATTPPLTAGRRHSAVRPTGRRSDDRPTGGRTASSLVRRPYVRVRGHPARGGPAGPATAAPVQAAAGRRSGAALRVTPPTIHSMAAKSMATTRGAAGGRVASHGILCRRMAATATSACGGT